MLVTEDGVAKIVGCALEPCTWHAASNIKHNCDSGEDINLEGRNKDNQTSSAYLCSCRNCDMMPTAKECICCAEQLAMLHKIVGVDSCVTDTSV